MATDSKRKLSYRGGMFLLLALLIIALICGFIIHHFSVVSSLAVSKHTDEGTFVLIICVAIVATIISLVLSVRLNRNIRNLSQIAEAMENGADIESMPEFSRDELGDLSRQFIDLYRRLRHASSEAEREHDNAMHEQQEKLRIKRQLTNNINHELKTPVAAIQGYLETIITNPDMTEEERHSFIEKCYTHSQRLTQLLTDVSTITRMEDGSNRIECQDVDLRAIINEIRDDIALLGDDKRMRVHLDLPEPMIVRGNSSLLISIFKNLTDNAIAYSGGRDIYIKAAESDGGMYTITLADNGIGIDDDHIGHIFERFYRIDAGRSRKLGGTGLGLSIVKNAVLFHGGNIEVNNRKVGGLEFRFTLPMVENRA
ncbi:MAG: hypothetical protein IKV29_04215 [Alistipes sp.]|nr:hypothetical protein [Alistipes sp.]